MMVRLQRRRDRSTATSCCCSSSTSSTSATTSPSSAASSASAATCVEVWPAYEEFAFRIELFGDEVERSSIINPLTGETLATQDELYIYPAKHFVTPEERIAAAVDGIQRGAGRAARRFSSEQGKLLEAQRLSARTRFDLEMLLEVGYCPGIENYAGRSRGRKPGEPPYTLLDFFPDDFLLIVDESHVTRAAGPRRCSPATAAARGRSSSTASACPAPSTTGRCGSTSGSRSSARRVFVSATPGRLRAGADPAARSSSR